MKRKMTAFEWAAGIFADIDIVREFASEFEDVEGNWDEFFALAIDAGYIEEV